MSDCWAVEQRLPDEDRWFILFTSPNLALCEWWVKEGRREGVQVRVVPCTYEEMKRAYYGSQ